MYRVIYIYMYIIIIYIIYLTLHRRKEAKGVVFGEDS